MLRQRYSLGSLEPTGAPGRRSRHAAFHAGGNSPGGEGMDRGCCRPGVLSAARGSRGRLPRARWPRGSGCKGPTWTGRSRGGSCDLPCKTWRVRPAGCFTRGVLLAARAGAACLMASQRAVWSEEEGGGGMRGCALRASVELELNTQGRSGRMPYFTNVQGTVRLSSSL